MFRRTILICCNKPDVVVCLNPLAYTLAILLEFFHHLISHLCWVATGDWPTLVTLPSSEATISDAKERCGSELRKCGSLNPVSYLHEKT